MDDSEPSLRSLDIRRPPCRSLAPSPSVFLTSSAATCRSWPAPPPPHRPWPCAPGSSCEPPTTTGPPTCASPPNSAATTPPSPPGAAASPSTASEASSTAPDPAGRRSFPPQQRLHVLELATAEDPDQV